MRQVEIMKNIKWGNGFLKIALFANLLFISMLSVVFIQGCSGTELTDAEYVALAKDYQDKGDLRASVIELKNALRINPANAEARWLLGQTYIEVGDGAAAEKELRRAGQLGVSQEGIVIHLGTALLLQGKAAQVLSDIQPLNTQPIQLRAEIHNLRGNAYLAEGKIAEATETFGVALELAPDLLSTQIGQSRLAAVQGKMEEASSWIDKALLSDPESAEGWSLLGDIRMSQDDFTEAEEAYSNAIQFRKYPALDIAKRAQVRVQLEKFEDAEADIKTLKQKGYKDHPYVNYVAGVNYFNQRKYSEAEQAFQASYTSLPSSLQTELYLATTLYILGRLEQAHSFAERVYAKAPRSLRARQLLGAIQMSRSELHAATEVLKTSLANSPDNAMILSMLGTTSLLQGDTSQGVKYAEKVLSLAPESRQAQDMLMVAKLMDGQALDKDLASDPGLSHTEEDEFTRELLYAVEAFRDGNIGLALEQAQKLNEKYPDKIEPINLIAACYLAVGQWDKAKIELERVLAMQANEPTAARNLAKVETQQGNLERARTLLKALVEEYPGDEDAILLLAVVETRLGSLADGTRVLEQAVEHNPNALTIRAKLAEEYLRAGRIVKVLEVTRDLSGKQFQQQPSLLEIRGKAQMLGGDVVSAKQTFSRWTEVEPDSAQAHFLYSDSLARSGDMAQARKQLVRAVQLDPNHLPARVGEIKMLVQQSELERAKQALANLKNDFGNRSEVLGIEGWFALGSGDYVTAEQRLSAAVEQKPDMELTILLTKAIWAQKKHDQAISVMQAWLEDRPQDLPVMLHLAGSYLTLNREAEAGEVYAKVVEIYPNYLPALNNLAWLTREKDLEQAIAYAERAHNLAPNDPFVLDTLGMLLLKKGELKRGYRMIQGAAERSPQDPEIQLHLGQALMQQERLDEAQDVLKAVVEKAPDSQYASEAKTLLESMQ